MKKTTLLLFAAAGCMALASCLKEPVDGLRLVAEPFQNESKMAVSAADGITLNFAEGDQVWINGSTYTVNAGGSLSETFDEAIYAVYPAGILVENSFNQGAGTASVNVGGSDGIYHYRKDASGNQLLDVPMVAYAYANATELKFRHLTAALTVKITNSTANTITLESVKIENRGPHRLWGTVTDVNLTTPSVAEDSDNDKKTVQMLFDINNDEKNLEIASGSTAYVQIPILPAVSGNGDHNTMQVEVQARNKIDGIVNSILHYQRRQSANSRFTILQNQLAIVPADINLNTTYATSGAFTIDAAGTKVFFSKGNLIYNVAGPANESSSWDFLTPQSNTLESSSFVSNDKYTHPGVRYSYNGGNWMSLFIYAANGNHSFNNDGTTTVIAPSYLPYMGNNTHFAQHMKNNFKNTNSISGTDYDWGEFVGDGRWYTLTEEQWKYLLGMNIGSTPNRTLYSNPNHDAVLYDFGKLNGVDGIFLYPDTYFLFNNTRANGGTVFPADWTTMEENGCVFLPVTGRLYYKGGNNSPYAPFEEDESGHGFYWAANWAKALQIIPESSAVDWVEDAASTDGYYNYVKTNSYIIKPKSYAVRLVHPAQAGSSK